MRPRESAGSFDHRFDAAARADIPSDGTWHTVTVAEIPVGLRTEYLCVPSVEPVVYATLVLSNATDRALLAGPVEVSVDGDFLLTAALPTLAPGGVSRVGLARPRRPRHPPDQPAGVDRGPAQQHHRAGPPRPRGAGQPAREARHRRGPRAGARHLRDGRPHRGAGRLDDARARRRPEHHTPGTRLWRVDLPAGGTTALEGRYEIRIPAGKALVGGNRRS
ncbi:hypothetical protein SF23_09275 [Streptomyces sp. MBRL 10]|nr:hypothetical protein SF23_09275 [Streptomyces sp. MBRL 10]